MLFAVGLRQVSAHHKKRGGQRIRLGCGRGQHGGGKKFVRRVTAPRVDDVTVTLAFEMKKVVSRTGRSAGTIV